MINEKDIKIGNTVRSTNTGCDFWCNNGDDNKQGVIIEIRDRNIDSEFIVVEFRDHNGDRTTHAVKPREIEFVSASKKDTPKDYHLLVKESCMNMERIFDNLKEAKKYVVDKKITQNYRIYSMKLVTICSPSVKYSKPKKSKPKKETLKQKQKRAIRHLNRVTKKSKFKKV